MQTERITELETALQKAHDALDHICKRAFEGGCLVNAGYRGHVAPKSTEYCKHCAVNNAIKIARDTLKSKEAT